MQPWCHFEQKCPLNLYSNVHSMLLCFVGVLHFSFQFDFNQLSCMLMTSFHVSVPNWPFLPSTPTQGSMGLKDSIIPRIPRQHSYGQIPLPPHLSFLTLDSPIPSPTGSPGYFFPSDSGSNRSKTSREASPAPCAHGGPALSG